MLIARNHAIITVFRHYAKAERRRDAEGNGGGGRKTEGYAAAGGGMVAYMMFGVRQRRAELGAHI